MTSNALRAQELRETQRSNKERERENYRSNKEKEKNERRKDFTTRRGQNINAANMVANYISNSKDRMANVTKSIIPLAGTIASLNDWEWYARSEEVAKNIASLPWGYRTGAPINMPKDNMAALPGVLTLRILPSIGISDSAMSGVNVAARQIYSWVRHANSGSANYEAVDLMQYIIALGNIYACFGHMSRILGLLQSYSADNAYIPRGILHSMEINLEENIREIPKLRAWLNNFGYRLEKSFAAPMNIPYFKRMLMVFSHTFIDTKEDMHGQIYMAVPDALYKYDELNGRLVVSARPTDYTVDAWINYAEDLYSGISRMETANIMSGDIRKAYGEENLFTFPTFGEDHTALPEYDLYMLEQFRNATLLSRLSGIISLGGTDTIEQQDGNLIFTPYLALENDTLTNRCYMEADNVSRFITTDFESPDFKDVLEATRWHARTRSINEDKRCYLDTCGSELVTTATISVFDGFDSYVTFELSQIPVASELAKPFFLAALKHFNYAPCVDIISYAGETIDTTKFARFMNVDKWTILDNNTLKRMNDSIALDFYLDRDRQ